MAFIATTGTPSEATALLADLLRVYGEIKRIALKVREKAEADIEVFGTGADANYILDMIKSYSRAHQDLLVLSNTPRLGEAAKIVEGSDVYDVVSEFTAMMTEIDRLLSALETGIPVDSNGYAKLFRLGAGGLFVPRLFDALALVGLVGKLSAVRDSIA